jgi:hypothetical protein
MSDRPSKPIRARWTLGELLDYELLLQRYAETGAPEEHLLDEVHAQAVRERVPGGGAEIAKNRRWWPRAYVRAWRQWLQTQQPVDSPGKIAEAALKNLQILLFVVGLFGGAGLVATLLAQTPPMPDGSPRPVNVIFFLGACLLPQLALMLWAVAGILRRFIWRAARGNALPRLAGALVQPAATRLGEHALAAAPDDLRAWFRSTLGLVLGRGRLHRAALGWPLVAMLQYGGLGYCIGMTACLAGSVQFRQVTFGWETSNPALVNADSMWEAAKFLAKPWSGQDPRALPSKEQVANSWYDTRSGVASSDRDALLSWWPFAIACLINYGFWPRLILLVFCVGAAERALARERFDDARSDMLLRDLARCGDLRGLGAVDGEPAPRPAPPAADLPAPQAGAFPCLAYLPPDLDAPETRERLAPLLAEKLGWHLLETRAVYTVEEQEALLTRVRQIDWAGQAPRILSVHRWNAAIVQDTRALHRSLLTATGPQGHLILALGGKLRLLQDPVTREQARYWREYADELKRDFPNVEVLLLGP